MRGTSMNKPDLKVKPARGRGKVKPAFEVLRVIVLGLSSVKPCSVFDCIFEGVVLPFTVFEVFP